MRYLVKIHGKSAPKLLLHELARTGSFEAAMRMATHVTPDRLARDWAAKAGPE